MPRHIKQGDHVGTPPLYRACALDPDSDGLIVQRDDGLLITVPLPRGDIATALSHPTRFSGCLGFPVATEGEIQEHAQGLASKVRSALAQSATYLGDDFADRASDLYDAYNTGGYTTYGGAQSGRGIFGGPESFTLVNVEWIDCSQFAEDIIGLLLAIAGGIALGLAGGAHEFKKQSGWGLLEWMTSPEGMIPAEAKPKPTPIPGTLGARDGFWTWGEGDF